MAYAFIENFKSGLDRRGSQLTGPPGSLWTGINCHINRRGEIERRKKFVSRYNLPSGTFGLHSLNDTLYTFGSAAETAEVLATGSITVTAGTAGAANTVETITVNGVDLLDGTPVAWVTSHAATATAVAAAITAATTDPNYTAVAVGARIDITAVAGSGATANSLVVTGTVTGDVTLGSAVNMSGGTTGTSANGVTYQRLRHPDTSTAMTDILDVENFAGAIYAIAEFADGNVYHFYDGTLVADWLNGIVRADMTNNDGIADHLGGLVDADSEYSATDAGAVVTITGPVGEAFTATGEVANTSGGGAPTITPATTQSAVAGTAETLATCSFRIIGGSASAGVNEISEITVNSVSIITSDINWATSNAVTAANIATEINGTTSVPNYTATSSGDTVTISGAAGSGDSPNGFVLAVTAAGNVIVDLASFDITGGTASAGVNKVTSVTIGGVEVMDTDVDWATSHSATATAVAAQINSFSSSPEYIAFADGVTVRIGKTVSTSTDGALSVVVTVAGDVTTGNTVNWSKTASSMSGGVDAVTGQAQITTVTIGGTFGATDRFSILLTKDSETKRFGVSGNPEEVGETVLTLKAKLYSTVSSILFFCGVTDATVWNREHLTVPGANFIDMSAEDEGATALTALGVYQGNLAVFARNVVLIESVDADPDLNVFLQPLKNTGTRSPDSVKAFGNDDLFYLADSGIRSIKARDSSNTAFVSDVGTPIDPLVIEHLKSLTAATITAAQAVLEPREDRYWLALGTRIYVFSFFPGSKVSAWSYYDLTDDVGAAVTAFARTEDKVYARSAAVVYLYGGNAGDVYPAADEIEVTLTLPFMDGGKPATKKNLSGFDLGCEGTWLCELLVNPADTTQKLTIGTVVDTTFFNSDDSLGAETTHFAPQMTCSAAGYAAVYNLAVHWLDPPGPQG